MFGSSESMIPDLSISGFTEVGEQEMN